MKILILMICLITSFVGCGALDKLVVADKAMMSGDAIADIKSVNLNDVDQAILTHAVNYYFEFTEKWGKENIASDRKEFISDYDKLKAQYMAVERIVIGNWANYSAEHQEKLSGYRLSALRIDNDVGKLIATGRIYDAVKDAVVMAATLTSIAKSLKP